MVVDTSAVLAILFGEAERAVFVQALEQAPTRPAMSAMSLLEASLVVLGRRGEAMIDVLDAFVDELIDVVPLDAATARVAREAFARFGRGRHAAGLNFGDCAAYALAKARGTTLLFKGEDFARTDVRAAVPG